MISGQTESSERTGKSENKEKKYFIFAGINGAGKTALYNVLSPDTDLGLRISIDDIVASLGDWHDTLLQIKAARSAMKQLEEALSLGIPVNQETTLPGEAIVRFAKKAKEHGYTVLLYYIGLENVGLAVERVRKRVADGGHGIEESVIRKRFLTMPEVLARLLPYCDVAYFYDNSTMFRQVAVMNHGIMIDIDPDMPLWLREIPGAPGYAH